MLEESLYSNNIVRSLTDKEKALLRHLLTGNRAGLTLNLDSAKVFDMNDGGMGSIRFQTKNGEDRQFGAWIAGADYYDIDDVLVQITINVDQDGRLFEIDSWKMDYSKLIRYPEPNQLKIRND